jgi:steroid delta-isomerase-like uncharacterized protein
MARDNTSIARRWVEGFNMENLTIAEEIIAPTYVMHDLHVPHLGRGPESYKKHIMSTHEAFPGLKLTVQDVFAAGDKVALRWVARGTHAGTLLGIAPTGKSVVIEGVLIAHIADGKIEEGWTYWDALGTVQQLAVIEPPFAPFPPGD